MQTNLKRFIYVWALPVIFLALTSFLLAEEPELKMNYKVENGDVLITFTNFLTPVDDSKLEFKANETPIEKEKMPGKINKKKEYKLIFPSELKNQEVNLRVFYEKNCIGSFSLLVPVTKEDIKITDVKINKEEVEITLSGTINNEANIEFSVGDIIIENEKLEEQNLSDSTGTRNVYKYKLKIPYDLRTNKVQLTVFNNKKSIGSVFLEFKEPKSDIIVSRVIAEKDDVIIALKGTIYNEMDLEFKIDKTILRKQRVQGSNNYEISYKLIFPYELKNERINLKVCYEKNCIASVPLLIPDDRKHLTITYDCRDLKNPLRDGKGEHYVVRHRKHATFRVINANPLLYRVTLAGQNKNYFIESPKVYQDVAKEAMTMKVSEPVQAPPANLSKVADDLSRLAEMEQIIDENYSNKKKKNEDAEKAFIEAKKKSDAISTVYTKKIEEMKNALEERNKAKVERDKAKKEVDDIEIEIGKETDPSKKEELKAKLEYEVAKANATQKQNDFAKIDITFNKKKVSMKKPKKIIK